MDDDASRIARTLVEMGHADEEDALVADLANARFVLLGEGTHGTWEFYAERARLTRRLIEDHGFRALLLEADLPDAWRVHRFVRGTSGDREELAALGDFQRFPRWMWRNEVVRPFVRWLAHRGRSVEPVGVWGMDLYGLHRLADMAVHLVEGHDPRVAQRLRAILPGLGASDDLLPRGPAATRAAAIFLDEVLRAAWPAEEGFAAGLAARGVHDAVAWAQVVRRARVASWNVRDTHMADVVDAVSAHLAKPDASRPHGGHLQPRVVIWAHNSHVGDARPSEIGRSGELSLGQLLRERHGDAAVRLVGFSTYEGSVTAARDWGQDPQRMHLRPAASDTWEALFHRMGAPRFRLDMRRVGSPSERPERAVGVVYLPERERSAHLFGAHLHLRYDHLLYYDRTRALAPLDPWGALAEEDLPETWPFAV
jgi:erythromycin esterase-like protein